MVCSNTEEAEMSKKKPQWYLAPYGEHAADANEMIANYLFQTTGDASNIVQELPVKRRGKVSLYNAWSIPQYSMAERLQATGKKNNWKMFIAVQKEGDEHAREWVFSSKKPSKKVQEMKKKLVP